MLDLSVRGASATFLSCLSCCLRKAYWRYVRGITRDSPNSAAKFGTSWHAMQEASAKEGSWRAAGDAVNDALEGVDPEKRALWEVQLAALADSYDWHYGPDGEGLLSDMVVDPESCEAEFAVDAHGLKIMGYVDGLASLSSGLKVVLERKTTATFDKNYWKAVAIDRQPTIYCYAHSLSHCVYDVVRRPLSYPGKKETLAAYDTRLRADIRKRPGHYFDRQLLLRGEDEQAEMLGELDVSLKLWEMVSGAEPRRLPCNRAHCFQYGECPYYDLCISVADRDLTEEKVAELYVPYGSGEEDGSD